MKNKIKVLIFVDRMRHGGIQSFICQYYGLFDKNRFNITVLTLDDGNTYPLEEKIESYDINLIKLNKIWITNLSSYIKYKKAVKNFFSNNNDFDIIHMHSSSKNYFLLKCAKKYGIKVRIAHSHNVNFQTNSKIKKIIGDNFKKKVKKYATHYFACSKDAGVWMFGRKLINETIIIPNAFDIENYKYDKNIRDSLRKEFNLKDSVVYGNVSRLVTQKNHSFLIDIFGEIRKKQKNAKLVLIGDGELKEQLISKTKSMALDKDVIFLGYKSDIYNYYNLLDVFVFPSLFEGLGMTIIEALCNDLVCYISSDVIPSETHISSNVVEISLDKSPSDWAKIIMSNQNSRNNRSFSAIKNCGYDIYDASIKLQKTYEKILSTSK